MSAKTVNEFFDKVEQDKSLQKKLHAVHERSMKESKGKAVAEVVGIASAAGFKFTAEDFIEARKQKGAKLAGSELADVTGQSNCPGPGGTSYYCGSIVSCGSPWLYW